MLIINDKYRLTGDILNVIPEEYREVENNRTKEKSNKWVGLGYYPTVQSAILGIMSHEVRQKTMSNDGMTMREFLNHMDNLRNDILDSTKDIKVVVIENESKK